MYRATSTGQLPSHRKDTAEARQLLGSARRAVFLDLRSKQARWNDFENTQRTLLDHQKGPLPFLGDVFNALLLGPTRPKAALEDRRTAFRAVISAFESHITALRNNVAPPDLTDAKQAIDTWLDARTLAERAAQGGLDDLGGFLSAAKAETHALDGIEHRFDILLGGDRRTFTAVDLETTVHHRLSLA